MLDLFLFTSIFYLRREYDNMNVSFDSIPDEENTGDHGGDV